MESTESKQYSLDRPRKYRRFSTKAMMPYVCGAVIHLRDAKGSTMHQILNYLKSENIVEDEHLPLIDKALKRAVKCDVLTEQKGGKFKLTDGDCQTIEKLIKEHTTTLSCQPKRRKRSCKPACRRPRRPCPKKKPPCKRKPRCPKKPKKTCRRGCTKMWVPPKCRKKCKKEEPPCSNENVTSFGYETNSASEPSGGSSADFTVSRNPSSESGSVTKLSDMD